MRPEVTERIRQMALDFTAQLSVVETPGEIEMAQKIYDTIADIDYYKKHPELVYQLDCAGDQYSRRIVVAEMNGEKAPSDKTIVMIGQNSLLFTLVFSMVTCMILGMGLPSIPAYIITSTVAAPALVQLGIPDIAAHMFCFYFAMFANLTPPVALASFAAAGISGGDPMKTGRRSTLTQERWRSSAPASRPAP